MQQPRLVTSGRLQAKPRQSTVRSKGGSCTYPNHIPTDKLRQMRLTLLLLIHFHLLLGTTTTSSNPKPTPRRWLRSLSTGSNWRATALMPLTLPPCAASRAQTSLH